MSDELNEAAQRVAAISDWLDTSPAYAGLDEEAHLWRRVAKINAEAGEVMDAMSGYVGENPRKGKTHTIEHVVDELLDTAVAALGAIEHIHGNRGYALGFLLEKIDRVHLRAGLR